MNDSKALENIRARLLPMFPLSVVFGGLEHQCLETCNALQKIGVAAELLDFYKADDEFDILHLFASTPNYYDICYHSKRPIVISAVTGAQYASQLRAIAWKSMSYLTQRVRGLQTNYSLLRRVYNTASIIICLNQLEVNFLEVTYNVPKSRIRIVTNGVNDDYFHASGELFIKKYGISDFVLFTGNIVQRKNPLRLAQVLQKLGYPGVFIGGTLSKEKEYADAFAAVVENSPNLLWIRRLHHNDPLLPSAYAAARVFCLPSNSETQSLSALEAMSTATPVILGDFPYAYQSPFEQALKCKPNHQALTKCLELAINEHGKYSIQLPNKYSWTNAALEIAAIYQQILL